MATRNYYAEIANGINSGNEMPSLPQIIIKVQQATMKDDTSVQELASLILDDLGLTGKVLKLANSAFYRRSSQRTTTVTQAVILLGFGEIQKIVTAISVYEFFSLMTKRNCFRDIWKHSVCTGLCAHRIALSLSLDSPETYLVGGLLHDIGKFVMGQYFPKEYEQIIEIIKEKGGKYETEEFSQFHTTHHEVGALVGTHWNLPEEICKTIKDHDFTNKTDLRNRDKMTQIVTLANLIAKKTCGFETEQNKIKLASLLNMGEEILTVKQETLMEIVSKLGEEIYSLAKMLDITIEDLKIDLTPGSTVLDEEETPQQQVTEKKETTAHNNQEKLLELVLLVQEICSNDSLLFEDVCLQTLNKLNSLLQLKHAGIFIKNEVQQLLPVSLVGADADKIIKKLIFQPNQQNLLNYVANKNAITILDAELHRKLQDNSLLTSTLGSSRLACFPLTIGRKTVGILLTVGNQFSENINPLEKGIIASVGQSIANAYLARR